MNLSREKGQIGLKYQLVKIFKVTYDSDWFTNFKTKVVEKICYFFSIYILEAFILYNGYNFSNSYFKFSLHHWRYRHLSITLLSDSQPKT